MHVFPLSNALTGPRFSSHFFSRYNYVHEQSYVLGFSLAAAFGQNFIYYTISNFNPLVCTTITTTRKFFTIVCSVIIFGHAIGPKQWG